MSDDITDFIRASREICDKATPGPWYVHTSCREVFDTTGHTTDKTYGTIAAWYPHTFTTREGKSGWDTCGGTTGCGPSRVDAWFCAHARTALPRALDMLEAQQRETEKWRDARDELARARRWDIDKLERQMDVVAEQLVVALRDGDALRKQLAEQQAEIARLRKMLDTLPVIISPPDRNGWGSAVKQPEPFCGHVHRAMNGDCFDCGYATGEEKLP